ncbi:MAG: glycosyltransferase [Deltaproteobacteria bacterium]|nr:MAG: glycosyltransferase [Deltaproteobacteria bacterium]
MTPAVSVVIRCRDEAAHLGSVLEAVLAQSGAPAFEVLALDSGSRDGTLDLLARHPVRVERLPPGSFSFGRALNRGAALAGGEVLVHLSAHCRPLTRDWLAALTAPFADAGVVATFGRQVPVPGVNPIEAIAMERNFPPAPPARVTFSNANGALRRAAVLARPFDEDIPAAEDHLWACGVGPAERIVYVPAAAVAHSHPMTFREWRFRFYINGLAVEYARRRGVELPWGGDTVGGVLFGRVGAFMRLAGTLARSGALPALARLPSYAVARTFWYARGVREGARRYGGGR